MEDCPSPLRSMSQMRRQRRQLEDGAAKVGGCSFFALSEARQCCLCLFCRGGYLCPSRYSMNPLVLVESRVWKKVIVSSCSQQHEFGTEAVALSAWTVALTIKDKKTI